MKVALVSPSRTPPFEPPMALVALKSYLQEKGISVVPIDANVGAIHYVLDPKRCRRLIEPARPALRKGLPEPVQQGLAPGRVIDGTGLELPPLDEARAQSILDRLEDLWTEEGFALSKDDFFAELAILNDALILASLRMYPHCCTVWGDRPLAPVWHDPQYDPWLHYYRDELVPRLKELSPDVIGISLSYRDQVFYGLVLVNLLRKSGVKTPVVVGGSYFSTLCKLIGEGKAQAPLGSASHVDSIGALLGLSGRPSGGKMPAPDALTIGVRGEGEHPLLQICECVERGESVLDVPGLVYIDPEARALVLNERAAPLLGKDHPKMDLAGIGIGIGKKYLTPIPMAPLMSSRGCYWNKCTFCNHPSTLDSRFRMLPVDVVAGTMESYSREFGVELVGFCDELMSPAMLRDLTAKLAEKDLYLPFLTMFRIEKGLLPLIGPAAERGLRFVCFGLESASERVISRMNKGYRGEATQALLDECVRHGVRVHYFIIFGFPTETPAEADETVDYLVKNHHQLWAVRVGAWMLTPGSYIMFHPEEFGIVANPGRIVGPDPATYTLTEGISKEQAHEYVVRLKKHPRLERVVQLNGQEDYRAIADVVRTGPPRKPHPGDKECRGGADKS